MFVSRLSIKIEGEGILESTMNREILCFSFLVYMCVCVYVSLIKGCFETGLQVV